MIVNIQGDEPLIDPAAIDAAVLGAGSMTTSSHGDAQESASKIRARSTNPNVVKVVSDLAGNAIYFSRCGIPYAREGETPFITNISDCMCTGANSCSAIPVFRWVRSSRPNGWSSCGRIENGYRVRVMETEYESLGVDTPEDLER